MTNKKPRVYPMPEKVEVTQEVQVMLDQMPKGRNVVYLLHFKMAMTKKRTSGTVIQVKHYLGLTNYVERRMYQHLLGRAGGGLYYVQLAMVRGGVVLAGLWPQDGHFEQYIKGRKEHWKFCPICRHEAGMKSCKMVPRGSRASQIITQNKPEVV